MKSSMTQATHRVLKIGIYRKEMTFFFAVSVADSLRAPEKTQGRVARNQMSFAVLKIST